MINPKFRIVITSSEEREMEVYTRHVNVCNIEFLNIVVDNDVNNPFLHTSVTLEILNNLKNC